MNTKHNISTVLRRFSGAVASLALAAGIAGFAPAVYAQAGALSNPSNCSPTSGITGFTWANGTLTLSCSPPPPPPSCDATIEPTSFAITTDKANGTTSSTVNVVVSRVGTGCLSGYTITYASGGFADTANNFPVGFSPANGGTVTFAPGEAGPKNIPVSTGTSPGVIGVWLTRGTSAANTPIPVTGGTAITVTQPAGGGGGLPSGLVMPQGCSTPPTYYAGVAQNAVQFYAGVWQTGGSPPLKQGETLSASFTYQATANTPLTVAVAQAVDVQAGAGADIEVSIDRCPATFTATSGDTLCDKRLPYPGTSMGVLYAYYQSPNLYCQLTPGQQYFINVRNVSANYQNGTAASCTHPNGCAVRIQPQNLN